MASLFSERSGWDRLSLSLALVAIALAATLYCQFAYGWFAPPPQDIKLSERFGERDAPRQLGDEDGPPKERLRNRDRDAAEEYAALILSRPLFSESRRGGDALKKAPVMKPAGGLQRYRLAATVRDGDKTIALLQGRSGADYLRLAQGEAHQGWRLVRISKEGVLFEKAKGATSTGRAAKRLIVDRDGARLLGD